MKNKSVNHTGWEMGRESIKRQKLCYSEFQVFLYLNRKKKRWGEGGIYIWKCY